MLWYVWDRTNGFRTTFGSGLPALVMSLRRRRQFVTGNIAWMTATAGVLILLDALSLELFFVVSLIGFLVITELTAPFALTPVWRRRLRWIIALGLIVFSYIVIRRILAILPEGFI